MRFVAVKSEAQQGSAMTFKARDLLVRQRAKTINALRGHMNAAWLIPVPQGVGP
jgi:transposase